MFLVVNYCNSIQNWKCRLQFCPASQCTKNVSMFVFLSAFPGCRAEMSQYTGYIRTPNVRYPPDQSPDYSRLITCEWIIKADGKLVTFKTVPGITNAIATTNGTNDKYEVSDICFHLLIEGFWAGYTGWGTIYGFNTCRKGEAYMCRWTGSSLVQIVAN